MSCQPASYTTRKQFRFTMQELQYYLPTAFINMHLQLKFSFSLSSRTKTRFSQHTILSVRLWASKCEPMLEKWGRYTGTGYTFDNMLMKYKYRNIDGKRKCVQPANKQSGNLSTTASSPVDPQLATAYSMCVSSGGRSPRTSHYINTCVSSAYDENVKFV